MRNNCRNAKGTKRGAAIVEGLVAIPFFIIIFAATMFISRFYNEKLRTVASSRAQAWTAAMAGCVGNLPALPGADMIDFGILSDDPLTQLCDKGFGEAATSVS